MIKKVGKYLFLFSIALSLVFLFGVKKAEAQVVPTHEVVINELMWMGSSGDAYDEWIELKNTTTKEIDITGWIIVNAGKNVGGSKTSILIARADSTPCSIPAGGYFVILNASKLATTKIDLINIYPHFLGVNLSLANSGNGDLILRKPGGEIIDQAEGDIWPEGDNTKKYSMERNDPPGDGLMAENWHTAADSIGFMPDSFEKGTPGLENSLIINNYPTAPILTVPLNNANLLNGDEVEFSWQPSIDPEGQEVSYEFYLGCSDNLGINDLIDSGFSETSYFLETNNIIDDYGVCPKYYWKIIASDGALETESGSIYSFTIFVPVYPDEVLEFVNLENAIIRQVQVSRIIDGDTIEVTPGLEFGGIIYPKVRLLFVDTPEEGEPFYELANDFTGQLLGQIVDLVISRKTDEQIDDPRYDRTLAVIIFQNKVFNTQLLEQGLASYYDIDNSVLIFNEWLAILQQAQKAKIGLWWPTSSLILSELLPDPVGLDSEGEWIEIYNPSDDRVVISRFLLDKYPILSGTSIAPKSFLVLPRSQTETTLNNTGDTISLFFPGGLLINETIYSQSVEGLSWARKVDGTWAWTTTLTKGLPNIFTTLIEEDENTADVTIIPINTVPIEILTGDFENFENKLVKVTGKVTSTSGDTFYLDDGSGEVKIYIQEKTGIDKPEMHKNDIFEVTGIVDLYGKTWRILPQDQDDIKLIEEAAIVSVTVKASTTKKASVASTISKAITPSIKSAKAVETSKPETEVKAENIKSPFWIQLTKAVLGLVAILLILFVIKILRTPKPITIGGHFGDDET